MKNQNVLNYLLNILSQRINFTFKKLFICFFVYLIKNYGDFLFYLDALNFVDRFFSKRKFDHVALVWADTAGPGLNILSAYVI